MTEEKRKNSQPDKHNNWIWIILLAVMLALGGAFLIDQGQKSWKTWLAEMNNEGMTAKETGKENSEDKKTVGLLNQPVKMIDVSEVVEHVSPSIVTVGVKRTQVKPGTMGNINNMNDLWQMMMFGQPMNQQQPPQAEPETEEVKHDIGTGFVVDSDGLVVTNKHVVSDTNSEYVVYDSQDNEYAVTKVYRDPINDLAILQVENLQVPALELADSDQLKVGQGTIAVGTALGEFRQTVTTGVVSGLGRTITASDGWGRNSETVENLIQTDAAINSGNSGGPLLDGSGRVMGVNVAMTAGAENIGFALPINIVKEVLENFETTGKFERPFLGVSYQIISEKAALMNEIPQGAYLLEVKKDSAAEKAGLKKGDVITKFGGETLKVSEDKEGKIDQSKLTKLINQHKAGERVEVEFYREGEKQTTTVELAIQ